MNNRDSRRSRTLKRVALDHPHKSPPSSTICGRLSYDLEASINPSTARRVALHPRSRSRLQALTSHIHSLGSPGWLQGLYPATPSLKQTHFRLMKAFWVRARVTGDPWVKHKTGSLCTKMFLPLQIANERNPRSCRKLSFLPKVWINQDEAKSSTSAAGKLISPETGWS